MLIPFFYQIYSYLLLPPPLPLPLSLSLSILYQYRIREIVLKRLRSYLSNRTQQVKFNSKGSNLLIEHEVSQGSILGPLLLIIYINDILKVCLNDII